MSITVMLKSTVIEKNIEKLRSLLKQYLPQTREYKGFIDIKIHKDEYSEDIVFYSKWEKKEDYESYLNWRFETGVMEKLSEVFESEPVIKFYNTLDV